MRISLLFLLLFNIVIGQKTQTIKFYKNIKDKTKTIKSLTIIDQRTNPDLGFVTFKKQDYKFLFENGDLKNQIESWFNPESLVSDGRDLILLVEQFKFFSEPVNKRDIEKMDIKLTMFEKKSGEYYYLDRINDVMLLDPNKTENTPRGFARYIDVVLADFIKKSYEIQKGALSVKESEFGNYENILKSKLVIFNDSVIKDGVYKDSNAFFGQQPIIGYELIKNSQGNIVRAKTDNDRVSSSDIYVYVKNGIAYKPTIAGDLEINRDDKGFYILSNRLLLFPEQVNSIYYAFGVVGGAVAAKEQQKLWETAQNAVKYKIYLDPFTGELVFPK